MWRRRRSVARCPRRSSSRPPDRSSYSSLRGNGNSVHPEESYRVIELEPDNDPIASPYPENKICTNKYTIFTFVPKNLFEQFRRIGNFYFLMSAVVSTFVDSPISSMTSWFPLIFVIMVTAFKQGYEDLIRYRSDQVVNNRKVTVIRRKVPQQVCSEQIVVGDIIRVNRDEDVPCDLVILHSNDSGGKCYVTTSNLDGETNLKTLHVPRMFVNLEINQIVSMNATVTCIPPMAGLYTFEGRVEAKIPTEEGGFTEVDSRSGPLGIENIMLRGARLRDTDYVVGCAVYTGSDTKLSLNSKQADIKFSIAEKSVNRYIMIFLGFLVFEVLLCFILKKFMKYDKYSVYLGEQNKSEVASVIQDLLSFTISFNFVIPISLYVTIEMQSFFGSFFFIWDQQMYDEETDQPALVNTSDLNEDLGQIEYLFSDKTGTLTENIMIFRRCYVNGNSYAERDCDGNLHLLPANGVVEQAQLVELWSPEVWHFMVSIALCHEVHIAPPSQKAKAEILRAEYRESFRQKKTMAANSSLMMDPSLPEYEAASMDEKALVEAAARCGVVFQGDNNSDEIEIDAKGTTLHYTRLEIFEFTSDRKRMSVVIEDGDGDIWLYCKGADTSVFPLIQHGDVAKAKTSITDFAMRGLRTLVIGYKKFSKQEWENHLEEVNTARQTMGPQRSSIVGRTYKELESGLYLLGISAVEDRLQDGVPETMEKLRAAGIKIWVLTGDKAETAENIAYFCGHFKPGTEILRLTNIYADQMIFVTLIYFERKMMLEPHSQYGLIIDGISLGIALNNCPMLLRKIAMSCEAVVCCRMSPLQKSQTVHLVKYAPGNPLTAAIGDGGNDVSMIKEAHVGLGITGREGRQAAMSADFAFAKFRHLERALLVHGHWYYLRISHLTQYFFYKNLVLTLPQLFFSIFSAFSSQPLYDSALLISFNLFFTSMPIVIYGLTAQDYSAEKLLGEPQLYQLHSKNYLMSFSSFIRWTSIALWQAITVFFIPYFSYRKNPVYLRDGTTSDFWSFSILIIHLVVLIVNLELLILSSHWNVPFICSIIFTEFFFYVFTYVYCTYFWYYDGDLLHVLQSLLKCPMFWLITILVIAMCIIPPLLLGVYDTGRFKRIKSQLDARQETISNIIYSNYTRSISSNSATLPNRRSSTTIHFPWRSGNMSFENNNGPTIRPSRSRPNRLV